MQIKRLIRGHEHIYECWDDYGCSVVASAVIREDNGHAHLKDINVSSSYRGRGIGTKLLKQIITDFKDRAIAADVFEARVPWYRQHGFAPIERTNDLIKIVRYN